MFNFSAIFADHDIITDADRVTTFRRKYKAPLFRAKSSKNEGPSENMDLSPKTF